MFRCISVWLLRLFDRSGEKISMNSMQTMKRMGDIVLALGLLLLLAPIFGLVIIAQLLMEGRPVFYVSRRHVSIDKAVAIPKFRTMVRDAKSEKYRLSERFMRDGYLDIPLSCEVYTPLGRLLERTQLVETLQLFTVLSGKMSFIGNRPLPLENIKLLEQFEGSAERFDAPAGISGITQVVGKYGLSPQERLGLERLYARVYREGNVLKCDLMIVIYTARLLLLGKVLPLEKGRDLLYSCLNRP